MKWQIKFIKNAIFGIFPLSIQEKFREIKRQLIPPEIKVDSWTVHQGLKQVEMLKISGCDPHGKDCLEIGTGWQPIIPLIFSLSGCKSIVLVDQQRLMDEFYFSKTCKKLIAFKEELSQKLDISIEEIEKRLTILSSIPFNSALQELNWKYLAPFDFLSEELPENSLDIITSRAVMEHIPPNVIKRIFCQCRQLLRSNGFMCHIIDNSDHWEHNDKSISRLNFLKFSPWIFHIISSINPLDYQNRLRHSQYKTMINEADFKIIYDDSQPDEKALKDLNVLKIHPSFGEFPNNDLAILTSYIVAVKE